MLFRCDCGKEHTIQQNQLPDWVFCDCGIQTWVDRKFAKIISTLQYNQQPRKPMILPDKECGNCASSYYSRTIRWDIICLRCKENSCYSLSEHDVCSKYQPK